MIHNFLNFLSYENIYLIANWGVIPFWLLLIIIPNHSLTNFFSQSVIAPFLLAVGYVFLSYTIYLEDTNSYLPTKSVKSYNLD